MFLEQINGPDDLKKINIKNLDELAEEIRNALIIKMSSCGGHLSSNLGVVEATIALHYVFNSPEDKIVFDVRGDDDIRPAFSCRRNGARIHARTAE